MSNLPVTSDRAVGYMVTPCETQKTIGVPSASKHQHKTQPEGPAEEGRTS